jgi:RNA polymerase sigma-70 factor (ECF subfamily)
MDGLDESRLAARLIDGEPGAFREFVEAYKKRIYGLAFELTRSHTDAEDISQSVFIKVYRGMGTFKKDARLSSWLYRITVNAAMDHLRKRPFFPPEQAASVPGRFADDSLARRDRPPADPTREAETALLRGKIDAALGRISDREKTVFLLRHDHDLSLKEIAEALGLTLGSVKSYLFRSIKKLQKELGEVPAPSGPGGLT